MNVFLYVIFQQHDIINSISKSTFAINTHSYQKDTLFETINQTTDLWPTKCDEIAGNKPVCFEKGITNQLYSSWKPVRIQWSNTTAHIQCITCSRWKHLRERLKIIVWLEIPSLICSRATKICTIRSTERCKLRNHLLLSQAGKCKKNNHRVKLRKNLSIDFLLMCILPYRGKMSNMPCRSMR